MKEEIKDFAGHFRTMKNPESRNGLRIVVAGKGGAGKTTITASLATCFAAKGERVLAVDQDCQQNLAFSLGYPLESNEEILPASGDKDYIEEKTGARPGESWGGMLRLNPNVNDVIDRFGIRINEHVSLLVMGSVSAAATGCLCPENALLNSIINFIRLREDEVIIMDTQAGVEHFGRAIAKGFSHAVIVTEPTYNSISVALHSARLADELGIPNIHLLVNKTGSKNDMEKVEKYIGNFSGFSSVNCLPFDSRVIESEPDVTGICMKEGEFADQISRLCLAIAGE